MVKSLGVEYCLDKLDEYSSGAGNNEVEENFVFFSTKLKAANAVFFVPIFNTKV